MDRGTAARITEEGILAVLAGVSLKKAAAQIAMEPSRLADAIELYQAAGYAALEAQADLHGWCQISIEFADRCTAEQVAVGHLRPELAAAQADGMIAGWFFTRKFPFWRLRYPSSDGTPRQPLARMLDSLAAEGQIIGWTPGIYEPEEVAFGGAAATIVAHELFCEDSRHVLDYLARAGTAAQGEPRLGRREMAILLSSVLMRSAGQDWYEQGDIWAKVAQHRKAGRVVAPAERLTRLKTAVCRLMAVDASPASVLVDDGPLASVAGWTAAFERAGQKLADLARRGTLERGLRAVLAHHVIFCWNRLGLSYEEQRTLSALAKEVAMAGPDSPRPAPAPPTWLRYS